MMHRWLGGLLALCVGLFPLQGEEVASSQSSMRALFYVRPASPILLLSDLHQPENLDELARQVDRLTLLENGGQEGSAAHKALTQQIQETASANRSAHAAARQVLEVQNRARYAGAIARFADAASAAGGILESIIPQSGTLIVTAPAPVMARLATHPDVAGWQANEPSTPALQGAQQTIQPVWSDPPGNLGEGVGLGIIGPGATANPYNNVADSVSCIADEENVDTAHERHVVWAAAARNTALPGPAPATTQYYAKIGSADPEKPSSTDDLACGLAWLGQQGVSVVNASVGWGSYKDSDGDKLSQRIIDQHIGTYQYFFTIAAGNDALAGVPGGPGAHNALAVAAAAPGAATAKAEISLEPYSSRGPTADGRRKPELAALGRVTLPDGTSAKGTSFAAPQVAGMGALLINRQWELGLTANLDLTTKAILINTAEYRDSDGQADPDRWDPGWGWGYVDLPRAFAEVGRVRQTSLAQGEAAEWRFAATAGERYRFTAAWRRVVDLSGGADQLPDANLTVIGPDGTTFGRPSAVDNVEVVDMAAPQSGIYRVRLAFDGGERTLVRPYQFVLAASTVLDDEAGAVELVSGPASEASPDPAAITGLTPSKAAFALGAGESAPVTLNATHADGRVTAITEGVQWSSSDPTVARISGGLIVARAPGVATLQASYGRFGATVRLFVGPRQPVAIKATQTLEPLAVGATTRLSVKVIYSDGTEEESPKGVVWRSSSPAVATVTVTGLLAGRKPGHTMVTAALGDLAATLPVQVQRAPAPGCAPPFADLPASHMACAAVAELVQRKAVGGFGDGRFHPDQPVTRAEFAKLLVTAAGLAPAPDASLPFADASGHWAAQAGYLQAAVSMKVMNGFPDGSFGPDLPMTRAQLVKIVAQLAGLEAVEPIPYADVRAEDWFVRWIGAAHEWGLIGPDGWTPIWSGREFEGTRTVTRAEAAVLLSNWLTHQGEPSTSDPFPRIVEGELSTQGFAQVKVAATAGQALVIDLEPLTKEQPQLALRNPLGSSEGQVVQLEGRSRLTFLVQRSDTYTVMIHGSEGAKYRLVIDQQ